ncbi:MAG: transposase family protein [Chloroflexi bacterium]|nr:transposase family protein [Chloroflexota bacterium]
MSKYKKYAEKPTEFLALTGYIRQEFDELLPHFGRCYYEWMKTHRLDRKPRGKRKHSDYKNSPLPTIEDKLFFILHYLKTNNLQTVQGALFGMSQPKANVWIHCLHPILNQALAELGELPARQMTAMTFAEDEGILYFHDGTERPIPRPCDPEQQRFYYSGKKTTRGQK